MSKADSMPPARSETERALLEAGAVPSRRCPAPGCGRSLTRRQKACSPRCRAVLSRQRRAEAHAERMQEIRALLLRALAKLDGT
jgi:predicted nucleic acid-binding Zn ribbon protein